MKTNVYTTVLALWVLFIANVYAVEDTDSAPGVAMQNEESTPYSYFLESELDNTYERGDDGSLYEIPNDDTLTSMSLLDLGGAPDLMDSGDDAEFDSDLSFLEEDEDKEQYPTPSFLEVPDDDEFGYDPSFMEADDEQMEAADLTSAINDELRAIEAREGELIDTQSYRYIPIRRRMPVRKCKYCTKAFTQTVVEDEPTDKEVLLQGAQYTELTTSYFRTFLLIGIILGAILALVIWLVMYTPAFVINAKDRVVGLFNREGNRTPVLPEVAETEPLMAQ